MRIYVKYDACSHCHERPWCAIIIRFGLRLCSECYRTYKRRQVAPSRPLIETEEVEGWQ